MTSNFSQDLNNAITQHWGWQALETFGANLQSRPLNPKELRTFLATTAAFFREIPGGILALGLRVTDDWMRWDRFGAVAKGAEILYSAVDEFGLHEMDKGIGASHHALFLEMTRNWGIADEELLRPEYLLAEGEHLAERTSTYYRQRSVPEALGFHVASEISSEQEFILCYRGFSAHHESYGLTAPTDKSLNFYYIHTLVEPMHGQTGVSGVESYVARDPSAAADAINGAKAFMDGYGRLFDRFNQTFYAGSTSAISTQHQVAQTQSLGA